jgi:hypothetical protein
MPSNVKCRIDIGGIQWIMISLQRFPETWADDLERAIAHHQQALTVFTREAFPEDWARTQANLAAAYGQRIRGERADNLERAKTVHGFRTGDRVRAAVPSGKKKGTHAGRAAVRASGSFNIAIPAGKVQGISWRHCTLLQRADDYDYATIPLSDALQSADRTDTTGRRRPTGEGKPSAPPFLPLVNEGASRRFLR